MAIKKINLNKFEHKLKMNLNIVACALKITPKEFKKKMANANALHQYMDWTHAYQICKIKH